MSLRLNGSTSGYVEIDAPATAGSNTLVLPTGNGTSGQVLSTNGSGALSFVDRMTAAGPAFSAYRTTAQTLTHGAFVKLAADAEEYDTASCYDSTTNYRFTPNVAGYYWCGFHGRLLGTSSLVRTIVTFYKNGASRGRIHDLALSVGTGGYWLNGSELIYLNGSTDYVEIYIYVEGNGTLSAGTNDLNTFYFQAHLARPA
jgi:hypothetical protein